MNRFTGMSSKPITPVNEQNITFRKKISMVSTLLQGSDGQPVASSPRNCYSRQNVAPLRRHMYNEADGGAISTSEQTPIEQKATEIRRMNNKKEASGRKEETPAPPTILIEGPSSEASSKSNQKKTKPSTSSLASVFRSRASSPMEAVRKVFGRSSSKQPKELPAPSSLISVSSATTGTETNLTEELEKLRNQLAHAHNQIAEQTKKQNVVQMVSCSQQTDLINSATVTTMTDEYEETKKEENPDKENVHPDIICLEDDENNSSRIQSLLKELSLLKKENNELKEDFRRTRKDFILILKEAVIRKDEAERELDIISKSICNEDDWDSLMSQQTHALRRNVLLMWVQKKLALYSDQLTVSNFSSDWADCRAFCALLYDIFPEAMSDVYVSPIVGDCVTRCRRTFQRLEIPFDERALGISTTPSSGVDDDATSGTAITGLIDWRYIMNTVLVLYKKDVHGK
ncbi:hypothetical protein GCK72_009994 [Caenorhabditis remanei]|uniref:Calponin-homology (CH) domain-containing protein n=1 Tax=Caenorhabditis remanei TaxID=31234 RepID=A0A6A5H231_CAERE|nr:hypothetical protein GCK72_009994 [Caenorhabditis remanei]KAF1761738.1 hypothetical protein GCK72_009994 [Caenorhabditis remanei]